MIHHNVKPYTYSIYHFKNGEPCPPPYGVSPIRHSISPQAVLKNYDRIRHFLTTALGFTTAQRQITLYLIRMWAYYGTVYPKEKTVTAECICGKATFWRTIALLSKLNMVTVINRYLKRGPAQISNLYDLEQLMLAIARYLSEHGRQFANRALTPYLQMTGRQFWTLCYSGKLRPPPLETV